MKNIFLFLPLFLLCVCLGNAQETIIKHTVSKGETVFQLSRKYNVSPEEIYALNPSAINVIKIDEVLSIPKKDAQPSNYSSSVESNSNSGTITYAVVYGDTKYSLARRYGISVEELEKQNPHTKNELQAGHILKIQSTQNTSKTSANYTIKKTHLVLKGQTLWGISRENGLKVEELVNANSDILNGILQIGQVLKVPNPYDSVNSGSGDTYLVQRGDTKYGLSKKYDITINELERNNPQIVRMLMAGQTIIIPNETTLAANEPSNEVIPSQEEITAPEVTHVETTEEPVNEPVVEVATPAVETNEQTLPEPSNASPFVDYEVMPKETLYGLSKKANMSISDFVSLNPELANGVNVGMIIKMPSDNLTEVETATVTEPVVKKSDNKYVDLSQSISTGKKNEVLLFLPFSESKFNDDYNQATDFKEVSDEFIRNHLEFYRGAKIAQDSAKSLGLDFNITIVETENSRKNSKAEVFAKESVAENYDALLLPFYENDTEMVATLVKDKNIPVVTTSTITKEQGLINIFNGLPTVNSNRNTVLDYLNTQNGNLIVVCDMSRNEIKANILSHSPSAKFVEVSKKGTFNADELVALLDTQKVNYVVLESEKNSVFLSTTNVMLGQLSNHNIQLVLLDKSLIPDTDDVSNKRFVILQMIYPSLSPLKGTSIGSNFMEAYKRTYNVEPSQNVKLGFDLTFDTLLRISQVKSFQASAQTDITEYTTLKFDYKVNEMGSHDNRGVYIIQYNTDATLKELK